MSVAELFDDHSLRPRQLTPPPVAAPANQNADAVSFTTWLAVIGATLGGTVAADR